MPSAEALPFGPVEAGAAADLHRRVSRARGREIDLAISSEFMQRVIATIVN